MEVLARNDNCVARMELTQVNDSHYQMIFTDDAGRGITLRNRTKDASIRHRTAPANLTPELSRPTAGRRLSANIAEGAHLGAALMWARLE